MIELDDVAVSFGDLTVLDGVDLTIESGEFVAIVGPNGAGKTTLLRTITGVLAPDSGTVSFKGTPVEALDSKEVSRTVAMVPQDTHVGFSFTAENIVEMGRTPHRSRLDWGSDCDPVESAMERTDTLAYRDRAVDDLSGGERQRVLLARALAQEPDALLLDEPTASLDINHQIRVLGLVESLVADGKTALAAIHDLDLAARFCDRLVLLHDGGIAANGPPSQVLDDPTLGSAFETRTAVTPNPVTGTPVVSALEPVDESAGTVHVLGGGTGARAAIRTLWRDGYEVTVGPVPRGDVAAQLATALDRPAVTVPRFEAPAPRHREETAALASAADVLVVTGDAALETGVVAPTEHDATTANATPLAANVPQIRAALGGTGSQAARGDGGEATTVDSAEELLVAVRDYLDGTGD